MVDQHVVASAATQGPCPFDPWSRLKVLCHDTRTLLSSVVTQKPETPDLA